MEKLILTFLFSLVFGLDMISNGDFQSFVGSTSNNYTDSWYNDSDSNGRFFVVEDSGNHVLHFDQDGGAVCQNISLEFRGEFQISFDHRKSPLTIAPFFQFVVDQVTYISTASTSEDFHSITVQDQFGIGSHKICFELSFLGVILEIDNVQMTLQVYEEVINYTAYEDENFLNCVIISIVFFDYFEQRYWMSLLIKNLIDNLQINGEVINQNAITLLSNTDQGIQIQVYTTSELSQNFTVNLQFVDSSITLSGGQIVNFTEYREYITIEGEGEEEEDEVINDPTSPLKPKKKDKLQQVSLQILTIVSLLMNGWIFAGITYFISNLFTFTHIIILYNYLDFQFVLLDYKKILNEILRLFLFGDIHKLIQQVSGASIQYTHNDSISEKLIKKETGYQGMLDHGFSSNFIKNGWDQLLQIGIMIAKLSFIRALSCIGIKRLKQYCKAVKKRQKIYFIYEIIAITPTILLPIGYVLGNIGSGFGNLGVKTFPQKMNLVALTVVPFILLMAPFLINYYEIKHDRDELKRIKKESSSKQSSRQQVKEIKEQNCIKFEKKDSDEKLKQQQKSGEQQSVHEPSKKKIKTEDNSLSTIILSQKKKAANKKVGFKDDLVENFQNKKIQYRVKPFLFNQKQKKNNIKLIENFLLFIIPFLIGIGNIDLFTIFSTLLMIFRILIIIKYRKIFTKWEFFKELFNRASWFIFNAVYICYWVFERFQFQLTDQQFNDISESLGLTSLLVIVIACGGEIVFLMIGFFMWVYELLQQCKSNKINPDIDVDIVMRNPNKQRKKTQQIEKREGIVFDNDLSSFSEKSNLQSFYNLSEIQVNPKKGESGHKQNKKLQEQIISKVLIESRHKNKKTTTLLRQL